jgi:uncharacterized protein YabN with tetrapyrrole methylase and pyrophosphatase domain
MMENTKQGSLVVVGTGMTLGAHITPICRSHIENADIVYCAMATSLMEEWIHSMNSNVVSLQNLYAEGKDRRETYKDMVALMMGSLREGKHVVGAFYGHPGIFALPPHKAVAQAREEGYFAYMEPGVSAEACLYADMGIDPGSVGSQQYEATQFMLYDRPIDTSAYLILWQIGMAGDRQTKQYTTANKARTLLKIQLLEQYPADHKVAIYEAKALPTDEIRIDWMPLSELDSCTVFQYSTLVIPPCRPMKIHKQREQAIQDLFSEHAEAADTPVK